MTKFRHLPTAGRAIIIVVAISVFAIAVVACATSYNAIYRLVGDLGLYGYRITQAFPLLLDRDVGLGTAVLTSIQAARANPVPIATWGLIVAGGLVLGAIPLFIGLVIAMPVLCHATWHLYRKLVPRQHA